MGIIWRFLTWLLKRLILAALLIGLALLSMAGWLQQQDGPAFAAVRQSTLERLAGDVQRLQSEVVTARSRIANEQANLAAQELRAGEALRLAKELEELNGGLARLTTSGAQLRENDQRRARLRERAAVATKRAAESRHALVRSHWERDGVELALAAKQRQHAAARENDSALRHYLGGAWTQLGRFWLGVVGLVMFGPPLVRFFRRTRPPVTR